MDMRGRLVLFGVNIWAVLWSDNVGLTDLYRMTDVLKASILKDDETVLWRELGCGPIERLPEITVTCVTPATIFIPW